MYLYCFLNNDGYVIFFEIEINRIPNQHKQYTVNV